MASRSGSSSSLAPTLLVGAVILGGTLIVSTAIPQLSTLEPSRLKLAAGALTFGAALFALGLWLGMRPGRARNARADEELQRVIARIPDHIWSGELTPDGFETMYFSPVLSLITGKPEGDFRDSLDRWYAEVHEEDLGMLQRLNAEVLTGQRDTFDIEYRVRRADGNFGWVRDRVQVTATKSGRRLDGIVSDITETKNTEAEHLAVEKERLLLQERQRLMREMHDGVGGLLVSTIAMLETGRSTSAELAESLRRALDDMRIVIDTLDPATMDTTTSLGKLRARLEPLLRRNGVLLRWRFSSVRGFDDYRPDEVLHLLRIIQEAVANALQHAKATEVCVEIGSGTESPDTLRIEIRDDGCGMDLAAATAAEGRGIGHMKSRAKALGADLRFDSNDLGTRVELQVAMADPSERRFDPASDPR